MVERKRDIDLTRSDAQRRLAGHVMREEPVRSFRFHSVHVRPAVEQTWDGVYPFARLRVVKEKASFGYDSNYAFTLTWTPGHLALVGDLGELTLVHYHALRRFEDIGWALSSDHDYLMGKTDKRRTYSAEDTFRDLIHMLNEPALDALNGHHHFQRKIGGIRQEMQDFRRDKAWNDRMFDDAWMLAEAMGTERPDWDDFDVGEPPHDLSTLGFHRRPGWHEYWRVFGDNTSMDRFWDVPDYWHPWYRVWLQLVGFAYHPEHSREQPSDVLKACVRRRLKDEMEDELVSAEKAADFLNRIGFDDYYGAYVWDPHTYFQIAAIQHGVRMILAQAEQPMEAA